MNIRVQTQQKIREGLNSENDNHQFYSNQPKSPLSPWLSNRKSKGRFRQNSIHAENNSDKGVLFLKQIQEKRKNFMYKSKIRHHTIEVPLQLQNLETQKKQKQEDKPQAEQQACFLMFPFNLGKSKKKSFTQRAKHTTLRKTKNFKTVKQTQIPISMLSKHERYKTEKSEMSFHTPEKSLAVTTIYGKKHRNKFMNHLKVKENQQKDKITEPKKLSLQEIHRLIGPGPSQGFNKSGVTSKIYDRKPEKKCRMYLSKRPFTNELLVSKLQKANSQLLQTRSDRKIYLENVSVIGITQPQDSIWLAPRSHKRGKSLKTQNYAYKTIYI